MTRYAELRDREQEAPPELGVDRATAEAVIARYRGTGAYLPQADAFELLAAYGIPVPRLARLTGQSDLAPAAARVGFPCVLKVDSADVVHKSDEGGVALGLADQGELASAFAAMAGRFPGPGVSFVLQEQKPAGRG